MNNTTTIKGIPSSSTAEMRKKTRLLKKLQLQPSTSTATATTTATKKRSASPTSTATTLKPLKFIKCDEENNFNMEKKIQFKISANNMETPTFYSSCYCVKPTTTENFLTLKVEDLQAFFVKYPNATFFICNQHQLTRQGIKTCRECITFLQFKYSFIVHSKKAFYTFPPPVLFVPKSINYFKTFINHAATTISLTTKQAKERYLNREFNYYSAFMNMSFQGGSLKDISSGKKSFVRNKILGFQSNGIRATLTIDASLSPHYATLPQYIFDTLTMACPLVIVNRAPSIKNTCIYVVEVGRNKDPLDYTIHINPFLTEGLHADQDGDELSIFYLSLQGDLPAIEIQMAITELKQMSWKYGNRHDLSFKSRYQFTQYHKYILEKFNDYFVENNALWASLDGTIKEKVDKIMELGCSTHYDELDDFINILINFTENMPVLLSSTSDIFNGVGDVLHVVNSGAKGTPEHIKAYLKNLFEDDPNNIQNLIDSFNKNIKSSSKLGKEGGRQFTLLHAVNSLSLHNTSIYYNDLIILSEMHHSSSMSTFYYNTTAVTECFKYIIKEHDDLISTDENEAEVNKLMNEYI
ncbi:LEF-9 [Dikerogammarus haemobaphes nudivirus]|nr:LEF-9 [Dikerogammarus haemobaphes nudivirus]